MSDKRLYHAVADKITKLINDGAYPPGSRLPGERELAEQFGVSRVTIREAEIALQALGQITIKTGSGAYVLDPSERDGRALPNVSAFELTEARSLFESEAAALAARNISDETLAHLDELIETMASDDPKDEEASQLADRQFHLAIAAAAVNASSRASGWSPATASALSRAGVSARSAQAIGCSDACSRAAAISRQLARSWSPSRSTRCSRKRPSVSVPVLSKMT